MTEITTKAGHKVLKVNLNEMFTFCFIPPICDSCADPLLGENYYAGVLNSMLCDSCYKKWTDRAVFYEEDAPYENKCIDRVKEKINLNSKEKVL